MLSHNHTQLLKYMLYIHCFFFKNTQRITRRAQGGGTHSAGQSMFSIVAIQLAVLFVSTSVIGGPMCGCEYRYDVLMELYSGTNGAAWRNRSGWGTTTPCSTDWYGVTCGNATASTTTSTGNVADVVEISLGSNRLLGTLPASLVALSSLASLTLSINTLAGTLPPEWSDFQSLTQLIVHSNRLNGPLPDAWGVVPLGGAGLASRLEVLFIHSNSLAGSIPASWASTLLVNLQTFFANTNYLNGTIPESVAYDNGSAIVEMRMVTVSLSTNQLTGGLPNSWAKMTNVESIVASGSGVGGTLPPSWGAGMTKLQSLSLSTCQIGGTLPPEWGHMSSLQTLGLDANKLFGRLPASWGALKNLTTLSLDYNRLRGTLPAAWEGMTGLTSMSMISNTIIGTLPPSWWKLSSVTQISLYSNNLTGTLPSAWAAMPLLRSLSLQQNSLAGTLPAEWGNMKSIRNLILNMNCLYGAVPANYSALGLYPYSGLSLCNTNVTGGGTQVGPCFGSPGNSSVWPAYCPVAAYRMSTTPTQNIGMPVAATNSTSSSTSRSQSTSASESITASPTDDFPSASSSATTHTSTASDPLTPTEPQSATLQRCDALARTAVQRGVMLSQLPLNMSMLLLPSSAVLSVVLLSTGATATASIANGGTSGSVIVSEMSTRGVARSTLLQSPVFAMNVTWASPARFRTAGVLIVGGGALPFSVISDTANSDSWHAIAVSPPADGWLDAATPVTTDSAVALLVVFECDGSPALSVAVTVPAPGAARDVVGKVETTVRYAQVASVLAGGASSGSSLGRVMATRSMVMCDADSAVAGGVVDLGLRLCAGGSSGAPSPRMVAVVAARSAVVSNAVLICVVLAVLLALSAVWCVATGGGMTLLGGVRVLVLPSSLQPVCVAVLPSTAAATTLLVARMGESRCTGTDVALVVVGAALSLLPAASLAALWIAKAAGEHSPWVCTKCVDSHEQRIMTKWRALTGRLLHRTWRWHERSGASNDKLLPSPQMTHAWVVLLEYRVLWYPAMDALLLAAVSVLAVAGGLDAGSGALCRGATAAVIALLVGELVVVVAVRPHTTLFSLVHSSTTLALTCLGVVAQLVFVVVSSTSLAGLWLVEASAVCNLAVVGLTAVQMCMDLVALLAAIRRRLIRGASARHVRAIKGGSEDFRELGNQLVVYSGGEVELHRFGRHDDDSYGDEGRDGGSMSHSSSSHRSAGRRSPAVHPMFRESSPQSSGGGGGTPIDGSFRINDSMRLRNMSMDSSSFLHQTEKRFWDKRGTALKNGSFLHEAAVLGGRVSTIITATPSPFVQPKAPPTASLPPAGAPSDASPSTSSAGAVAPSVAARQQHAMAGPVVIVGSVVNKLAVEQVASGKSFTSSDDDDDNDL